ncbi:hypothetical protein RJ641_001103 [Dillenia turbinata]|uniref:Uncharacterized protein n=1 Tax=Dillenia turbinata TaxID=194707 RepID=A0AAN8W7Y8_9MAGN
MGIRPPPPFEDGIEEQKIEDSEGKILDRKTKIVAFQSEGELIRLAMGELFTIQISSNLVNQLADDGERVKRKTKKPKARVSRDPQPSTSTSEQKPIVADVEAHKESAPAGWPLQAPLFLPVSPPPQPAYAELDAIRAVLQDSERVVERLGKLEEEMGREVTQRAEELRDKEFKLPYQKPMPCLAEKDACLLCYKENATNPLKCAGVVNDFADCVRRARQHTLSHIDIILEFSYCE